MNKRSYNQYCALARGLDVIGERWTFLLIRELLIEPKRYKELTEALNGMGTNLLAARLKELEKVNVIERVALPHPYNSFVYQLTDLGKELEPAVLSITKWGFNFLNNKKSNEISKPEWDLVALKAAFRPEKSDKLNASYELILDGTSFNIVICKGRIDIKLGKANKPKAVITTSRKSLLNLGKGTASFNDLIASGNISIEGSLASARQFFNLFYINTPI